METRSNTLNERKEIIKLLLQQGADPTIRNKQGKTPGELEPMLPEIMANTKVENQIQVENNLPSIDSSIKKDSLEHEQGHALKYREKAPPESNTRIQRHKEHKETI